LFASLGEALLHNHGDLHVLLCLIDQQPEDVAVVRRALAGEPRCEIVASTFDELPLRHMALAELALARAQREVEAGRDVVLLFDSLTALARACNVEQPPTGRLLCAGMDAAAVLRGKRLFAAARACEEGGSLTVIASCVRGNTRGDEAVLEEFRHRGNSEVTFHAGEMPGEAVLDVLGTATRAEDLLLCDEARAGLRQLRLALLPLQPAERLADVTARLAKNPQTRILLRQLAPQAGDQGMGSQGFGR
jgi:transcription termination factor Rho